MTASTAIVAQGSTLKLGTTAAAKNITAASKANPVQLTITAHGLSDGTIVALAAVGGMTELNGLVGSVKVVDANTISLPGINSTNFTTYTSGGTATPTQVTVGNMRSFSGFDGQASEIDTTHLSSTAKEYLVGLRDFGNISIDLDFKKTDQGQQALRGMYANTGIATLCTLTLSDNSVATFNAMCKQFSLNGGADDAVRSTAQLRITGDVTWS